ncbi:hypothetical protein BGI05_05215 [Snodgrassella alvi]|uniref:hypothetical protein n=1 Tax=Snodgrassella alvi TaxID=1196083 RepID=UPI000A02E139|nr:hypothetical protein [Snodgrassella alvi]ORF03595.1 hypothetical protein BGH97_02515 [Snodgrassella alvi]ORF09371.1 hypothetical protein BGH99_02490 [Snodgrassella alvi]ORF14712.1 hypothetical protein BGI00_01855 [Snodgrassella alvi]ORF15894.1 hypothetical protein BGI02_01935 [Snodgrassella alvi]ORF21009.1 hypothetical protein BGI05_05215 [Snodgrassella alvi]
MRFEFNIDHKKVTEGFSRAPKVMERKLGSGLDRAAMTMVQAARDKLRENDSIALTTLLNSIYPERPNVFERDIYPHVGYAYYVEKGTKPGYYPPIHPLIDWFRARGSEDPESDAHRLKKHIYRAGTRAHPFWQPAYEKVAPKLQDIIEDYVVLGLKEVFG